jgi:MFS family permease
VRLPEPRLIAGIVGSDAVGTGAFTSISTLYFVRGLGLTPGQVGAALSLAGFATLVAPVVSGRLADRLPARTLMVGLHTLQAVLVAGYLVVSGFLAFSLLTFAVLMANRAVGPVQATAMVRCVPPEARVAVRARMRALFNGGFAVGTGLALALVAVLGVDGTPALLLLDSASFLVCAALSTRLPADQRVTPPVRRLRGPWRDRRFLALGALAAVLQVHQTVLTVGLPVWVLANGAAPAAVPAAFILNTIAVVTLQARAGRAAPTTAAAARLQGYAGAALAVAVAVLAVLPSAAPLAAWAVVLAAAAALTVGELWTEVASWGLLYGLAPEHQLGAYQGVWSLGTAIQSVCAPAALVWALDAAGAAAWWLVGLVVLAAGLVSVAVWERFDRAVPATQH